MEIKQLKLNEVIFVPQTTAEAVVVRTYAGITTLDKVINNKLETIITPENSGLEVIKDKTSVTISHTNKIIPDPLPKLQKIAYDSNGHITNVTNSESLSIKSFGESKVNFNGNESAELNFGDDFNMIDNTVILRWNNL